MFFKTDISFKVVTGFVMGNVYSNSKMFHYHDKLDDIQAGRLSAPIHVRLKPTNSCTHRCYYCCYRNDELYLSERMNERDKIGREKMQEIISDLGQMGVKAVTLTGGGEPLCYRYIVETIQGLLDAGIKVAMLTHGGLLKGEVAELLARRAVWVRISMDAADRETYAKNRGVALEEFDRVCENIRNFADVEGRKCVLGLNLIVTKDNSADVLDFFRMAKELGADHVKASGAVVSTKRRENAEYIKPFYQSVKDQIAEGIRTFGDDSFAIIDKFHLPDSTEEGFERQYKWCPFAQYLTVIAADENVYTCQDKAYTSSGLLGSIKNKSFAKLWFSDELKQKLLTLNPGKECRHHCVAHGKNVMLLDYFEADQEHLDFV